MTIKVALLGLGRVGRCAAGAILCEEDMEIVAGYDMKYVLVDIGVLSGRQEIGVKTEDVSKLGKDLLRVKPDVVVDFTLPEACVENSKVVGEAGACMVVGTTGLTPQQLAKLKKNLKNTGLVISPNMSVGVNVFWQIIGEAARKLPGYDIEIIEAHHRFKKDAPSGTALRACEILAKATGADTRKDLVHGRKGASLRKDGEIGVHSIRAGDIVGEHTVMFSTLGERFEVKHVAHTRDSFTSGIPAAIRFINGKKGVYDMWDVLGLR